MYAKEAVTEWREAKPPRGEPGPIYGFRRGYRVAQAGRHENADQYACLQHYLRLQGNRSITALAEIVPHSEPSLSKWSKMYEWERRAAAWDKNQMALVWREAEKMQRNKHKDAIVEFRESSERQARIMARVSEDLLRILGKRIEQAENSGEEIPINVVSNLLKAAASVSEQSRQSWANSLGVHEMLEMVESEMTRVTVEDVTEVDAYDIPLDE